MLSFSEFEHDLIVQRTQEGKAIAKQNANYHEGRPKKFKRAQLDHALELLEMHSYKQVERLTGISVTTIYRAKLERTNRKHYVNKIAVSHKSQRPTTQSITQQSNEQRQRTDQPRQQQSAQRMDSHQRHNNRTIPEAQTRLR